MKLRIDPVGIVILIVHFCMWYQYVQQEKLDTQTLENKAISEESTTLSSIKFYTNTEQP